MKFADMYKIERENNKPSIDTTNLAEDETIEAQQELAKTISDTNNDVDAIANLNQQHENINTLKANVAPSEITEQAVGFAKEALLSTLRSVKYPEHEMYMITKESMAADTPAIALEGIGESIKNAIKWIIEKIKAAYKKIKEIIVKIYKALVGKWDATIDDIDDLPDELMSIVSVSSTKGAIAVVGNLEKQEVMPFDTFVKRGVELVAAMSNGAVQYANGYANLVKELANPETSPIVFSQYNTAQGVSETLLRKMENIGSNAILKRLQYDKQIPDNAVFTSCDGYKSRYLFANKDEKSTSLALGEAEVKDNKKFKVVSKIGEEENILEIEKHLKSQGKHMTREEIQKYTVPLPLKHLLMPLKTTAIMFKEALKIVEDNVDNAQKAFDKVKDTIIKYGDDAQNAPGAYNRNSESTSTAVSTPATEWRADGHAIKTVVDSTIKTTNAYVNAITKMSNDGSAFVNDIIVNVFKKTHYFNTINLKWFGVNFDKYKN